MSICGSVRLSLDSALKTDIDSRPPAQIEKPKDRTHKFGRKLAHSARRIRKIFEIKEVRYAAEIC